MNQNVVALVCLANAVAVPVLAWYRQTWIAGGLVVLSIVLVVVAKMRK